MRRRMPMRRGRPGLMGTVARTAVVAGTATAVAGGVHRHQEQKAAQQEQAAQVQAQQAAGEPPASDDRIAKIKDLDEMKAKGLLTESLRA